MTSSLLAVLGLMAASLGPELEFLPTVGARILCIPPTRFGMIHEKFVA